MTSGMNSFDGSGMGAFKKSLLGARNDTLGPWIQFLVSFRNFTWIGVEEMRALYLDAGFQVGKVSLASEFLASELGQTRLIHYHNTSREPAAEFLSNIVDDSWRGRFVVHNTFLTEPPAPDSGNAFFMDVTGIKVKTGPGFPRNIPGSAGGLESTSVADIPINDGVAEIVLGSTNFLAGRPNVCTHTAFDGVTGDTIEHVQIGTTHWVVIGGYQLFGVEKSPEGVLEDSPIVDRNKTWLLNLAIR